MKWVKVFAVYLLLHALVWGGAHLYWQNNPERVLIVADTSFSLKPEFVAMQEWIEDFAATSRYRHVIVGTDKAMLGDFEDLRSADVIFRTAFGRSSAESLARYSAVDAGERFFLSDGSFEPAGWKLVRFAQ